ncbi:MAG: hypothetical protein DWQ18_02795 [Crenarchaeota archaeon]|nr:MAG: hypothetical protein DWQ17_05735 [Thermoproteota archaeon]RDJ33859.1 MAG: hypothetical protein DWQ18_02795 [Thermoproteota archaeon]RDJ37031.1 MAG: hypothetical protein DWQ13_07825 [Thermoproteota archaeon]RDJ37434.1 MAG: hypothetical protein DWQ19_03010 [Thermoproteota archaeon]
MQYRFLDKIITGIFVCMFTAVWFFTAKYYQRPKQYSIIVKDKRGNQINLKEIRSSFQTQEVAYSFLREYEKSFPNYNFAIEYFMPKMKSKAMIQILKKL